MEGIKIIFKDRRFHRLAGVGLLLGGSAIFFAYRAGLDLEMLKAGWMHAELFLRERPWWLFAALVILPGFPVPMTALMLLTGTMWRDSPMAACAVVILAMALNMCWTYWLAARPARGLVEKLLSRGTIQIPKLQRDNHLRTVLLMRLTPGIPLFVQNYVLGFLQIPFRLYLLVSMACSGLIACGVVLSGAGVAGGNFMPAITGVGLLVVGLILVKILRRRLSGAS